MKKIIVFLSAVLIFFCASRLGYAQQKISNAPHTISYQGYLVDAAKKPLDGIHSITIKLYDAPLEGTILHTENFNASVESGVFSVLIGSIQPLESNMLFDKQYWLGVSVDDAGELSPRTALASVPYAIHADAAGSLIKGGSGAVTTFNGRSGDLILKGGAGTLVQTEGNTVTISASTISSGGEQTQATTVNSITGTANQVLANSTSGQKQSGDVTLTLPQNINTGASPSFNGMTLTGLNTTGVVHNNGSGGLSTSLISNGDVAANGSIAYSKLNLVGSISNNDVASGANIASSKLNLTNAIVSGDIANGTIVNADINGSANIAYAKLNLVGSISNNDVSNGANIAASKLNLTNAITSGDIAAGTIMNSDINAGAGIAYSKLNLIGSISNSDVAAGANIAASKLNLANAITSGDIAAGTIMNSDINAAANIAASKLNLTNAIVSGDIANGTIVNADVNAAAAIAYSKLNLNAAIINSDIAAGAAIADTKFATISTAGKVANSATTAASANTNNAIVTRDGSGNFSAGTITASLTGNATNITGTLNEAHGGTNTTTYTKGDILYASAANTLSKLPVGALGQVLTNSGGVPSWAALSGVGVTSATGTANQIFVDGDALAHQGGIILSLPQNIHSGASPTFAGLTLSGKGTSASTLSTDANGTLATKDYVDNIATEYWSIGGNSGLSSGTNYFGTNDAVNLSLKTNGIQRLLLTSDGSMLLAGTTGSVPASGAGTRMMWIPSLGAFRVGSSVGSEWDSVNLGAQSVAMGLGTYAIGAQSVAMGYFSSATDVGAVAIGYGVTSSALGALALGSGGSQATGVASSAIGYGTTAIGASSVAMGEQTTSTGDRSFAEGYNTESGGNYSFASGKNLKVGTSSFGFNGSTTNSIMDVSSENNSAYFGDVNLIIGNDDNNARSLMFYGSNNLPNLSGAFYTSFAAQTQTANIAYTLPASQGAANSLLTNNGSGMMSWSSLASLGVPSFTGTANNLAVWSSSSALGAGSALYYNAVTNRLGIGVSSPAAALDVTGNTNVTGNTTVTGNSTVSGTITASSGISTNGIAMSGGTAVLSYGTVTAGATITIPNNAVVKINDDAASAANAVSMPSGTNGQIIYIFNNDAQDTSGNVTIQAGKMGVFVYIDTIGWQKAN